MLGSRIFAMVAAALAFASCSRVRHFTAAELAGVYVVERANPEWAKRAGYSMQQLSELRLILSEDGSARLKNFPAGRQISGAASWSLRKPEVIDLRIVELNLVVPISVGTSSGDAVLTYSEDPEFPTNLRLKKRPNQSPEPTAMSVTPRACARVAPAIAVAHL
jgi:hypothetical protein